MKIVMSDLQKQIDVLANQYLTPIQRKVWNTYLEINDQIETAKQLKCDQSYVSAVLRTCRKKMKGDIELTILDDVVEIDTDKVAGVLLDTKVFETLIASNDIVDIFWSLRAFRITNNYFYFKGKYLHCIAYSFYHGKESLPKQKDLKGIDHINNKRKDNRIENLQVLSNRNNAQKRLRTHSKQTAKCKLERHPTYRGVFKKSEWFSKIAWTNENGQIQVKQFTCDNPEEARDWYDVTVKEISPYKYNNQDEPVLNKK